MEVLEAIRERRAVRSFLPQHVEEATLQTLLVAATQAPSARNAQPWSFVVIEDRELLRRLSRQAIRRMAADPYWRMYASFPDPDFDIFYGAPALVVICARRNGLDPTGDCYLAGQNLMLAAHALGLGTCPVGLARDELASDTTRRELSIPEGVDPVLPIVVGYTREPAPQTEREPPLIHAWLHAEMARRA